jgi:hypothetical protein
VIEGDTWMTDGPDWVELIAAMDKLHAAFGLEGDWVPDRKSAPRWVQRRLSLPPIQAAYGKRMTLCRARCVKNGSAHRGAGVDRLVEAHELDFERWHSSSARAR